MDTEGAPKSARLESTKRPRRPIEVLTLGITLSCYGLWIVAGLVFSVQPALAIGLLTLTITLHSSLQHEALHGHPTGSARLNEALVFLPIGVFVPYRRYKSLHLRHHADERLTDPFDDPESYYVSAGHWRSLPGLFQTLLNFNNTLVGRVTVGPALAVARLVRHEITQARSRCDSRLGEAWAFHLAGLVALFLIVHFVFAMPVVAYLLSAYLGLSILSVRSFCEHRWSPAVAERTVVIESGMLSLLFLNNNLHLVHHRRPSAPWYTLPRLYRASRADWRAENGGYVFRSYWEVIRLYAFRAKEPGAHPGLRDEGGAQDLSSRVLLGTADVGAV